MTRSGFLTLGRIEGPHGLKGELRLVSYASSSHTFDSLSRIYLKKDGARPKQFRIRAVRRSGSHILLELEGLSARQQAEPWKNAEVWARKRDLPPLEPDELYLADLIGFSVYLPDQTRLGDLESAEMMAGQELWTIRTSQGRQVLFPAREELVPELDPQERRVVIDPPPGLLAVYGAEE